MRKEQTLCALLLTVEIYETFARTKLSQGTFSLFRPLDVVLKALKAGFLLATAVMRSSSG